MLKSLLCFRFTESKWFHNFFYFFINISNSTLKSGIYLHIPFCRKRCNYCNFFFTTNAKLIENFIEALLKEIEKNSIEHPDKIFDTIYFGGGTPSMLSAELIGNILERLQSCFNFSSLEEVTLECNPEDLKSHLPADYKDVGVTRLSMGVQSLSDNELKSLTREHTSEVAKEVLSVVKNNFENFSLDIIFSIPGQTIDQLDKNINTFLDFNPPHISAYILTFEEKTPLYKSYKDGLINPNSDTIESDLYMHLSKRLTDKGYRHYEVSNFAKPGFEAIHNSKYWNGNDYLGLGPSAHSYLNGIRSSNVRSVTKYINYINSRVPVTESHHKVSITERQEEELMLKLRSSGMEFNRLGELLNENYNEKIDELLKYEYAKIENGIFKLTPKGYVISDEIVANLISFLRG